jgi:ATP-dependent DNA ligase
MAACPWLDPFVVTRIEFLEWTPDSRPRHPRFAGIRSTRPTPATDREAGFTLALLP